MDPITIMAISAGIQGLAAGIRNVRANRGLKELEKQKLPSYMDAAGPLRQNYRMAEEQFRTGLSPAAKAMAVNTAASQRAQMMRGATELSGGQMSSALSRMGALGNAQMALGLGAQDQAARERGMQQMMGVNQQLSGLQQRDVGASLQRRMEMERGYGQAIQDSRREALGAVYGLATGMVAQNNFDKQMELLKQNGKTQVTFNGVSPIAGNPNGLVQPAGSFNSSTPLGPQTFDQYLKAGTPAGTTTTQYNSYSPNFGTQPQPIQTPFSAPPATPNFSVFTTPGMMNNLPSGARLQPTPIPMAPVPTFPISPTGAISVPNNMSPSYRFGDMSGDPFYNQVYNPNALRFSNPYNMNRGFMDAYDAVPGPYGQIMFKPSR